jgi:hypothetical protein
MPSFFGFTIFLWLWWGVVVNMRPCVLVCRERFLGLSNVKSSQDLKQTHTHTITMGTW